MPTSAGTTPFAGDCDADFQVEAIAVGLRVEQDRQPVAAPVHRGAKVDDRPALADVRLAVHDAGSRDAGDLRRELEAVDR